MVSGWPLVGREAELARIDAAVARGHGVLLAGQPGVGKTRLMEAALARAADRGLSHLTVVASRASQPIPLGCLSGLLALGDEADGSAAGLVGVRRAIEKASNGSRLVVAVDDAQWLDDASAVLIHQLVAAGEATVVASAREGAEAPAPVTALWKDGLLERIDVHPLDTDAVVAVLETVLGGQVERAGAVRLATRCRGNALFLRELIEEAQRLQLIREQYGVWVIGDPPARSARLAELVADRIGDLDDPAREVLELIALAEPVGLAMLERLASVEGVETLERRGLAALGIDGRRNEVRLAHPVHGDVVRSQLPELRRRRLQHALADDLEAHGHRRRGDAMRLALLRMEAGDDASPEILTTAAWDAFAASALPIAERFARAAYEAAPSFATTMLLANIDFGLGRFDEQDAVLTADAAQPANDEERAIIAVSRTGAWYWGKGDLDATRKLLTEAESSVENIDAFWALRAMRAVVESQCGDHHGALALLDECPDLMSLDVRTHSQVALVLAFALPGVGRGDEALSVIDVATERAMASRERLNPFAGNLLPVAKVMALVGLGRLHEARALVIQLYDDAVASGERTTQAYAANARGWVGMNGGQLAEAIRYYREAVALFRDRVHRGPTRWALGGVLFASALARDREVAAEAARALDEAGQHPSGLFDVAIGRARAWAALAIDDPGRARAELEKATALARGRWLPVEEATCLHDRVRIGDAADVAERLAQLAEKCDGTLVPTMAAHAAALTNGDVNGLEKVADDFAEMGYLLKAAEAAMGASEAAARTGDQRRAARLSLRAAELAERCETPATPMLTSPGGPVPLTNREREVAILAASGLTSRAIAERLFLSARTVDNHLARIYSKLGITSRAELTAAIG